MAPKQLELHRKMNQSQDNQEGVSVMVQATNTGVQDAIFSFL